MHACRNASDSIEALLQHSAGLLTLVGEQMEGVLNRLDLIESTVRDVVDQQNATEDAIEDEVRVHEQVCKCAFTLSACLHFLYLLVMI